MSILTKIIDEVANFNITYSDNHNVSIAKSSIAKITCNKGNGTIIFCEKNNKIYSFIYSDVEDANNLTHAFSSLEAFQSYISSLFINVVDIPLLEAPINDESYVRKNGSWVSAASLIAAVPSTGLTFIGQFNLTNSYQTSYVTYSSNVALTPTVATSPLVGASARLVVDAGASASLVVTNLGTLRVGSNTFTASKLNEIVLVNEEEGLYYNIEVLN